MIAGVSAPNAAGVPGTWPDRIARPAPLRQPVPAAFCSAGLGLSVATRRQAAKAPYCGPKRVLSTRRSFSWL